MCNFRHLEFSNTKGPALRLAKLKKGAEMINALKYTEDLERAGFTPEQAKSSVKIWMDLMNDNFATKNDINEMKLILEGQIKDVRVELKNKIGNVQKDLKNDIRYLESKLTIKLGGLMAFGIGLIQVLNRI